jgi:hypothetical protein
LGSKAFAEDDVKEENKIASDENKSVLGEQP